MPTYVYVFYCFFSNEVLQIKLCTFLKRLQGQAKRGDLKQQDEKRKVTLIVKNVSAEARHMLNWLSRVDQLDRGDVLSEIIEREVERTHGPRGVAQCRQDFDFDEQSRQSNTRTHLTPTEP